MQAHPPQQNIIFSDRSHWRFGWGDGLYNFDDQFFKFWASFGPCQYEPKTFDKEVAAAARKIADATTKPIYIAMSGGLDSELVARIFVQERIPFTPVIVQYEHDYNKEDISYAFSFCQKHQLTPKILRLDILAFFKESINAPYILKNCAHLLQMHIMRSVAALGGMTIICVGEQRYIREGGQIYIPVPQERVAVTHFMHAEAVEGVSAFYCYTPEMMLSFLREAKTHGFDDMSEFAHNIKEYVYQKFWPDFEKRPKYSGFELVAEQRREAQRALRKKHGPRIFDYSIALHDLEAQLAVK